MSEAKNGRLIRQGKKLYKERLRNLLEPDYQGKYVAIEPESGDYYLGHTMSEAYEKAAAAYRDKKFYLTRVGSRAAISFKHRTSL